MARLNLYKHAAIAYWLAAGNVVALHAQDVPPEEYRVKAVFLYNFTQFVEWPPASFQGSDDPFVVGILGEDPFGEYLEEVVEGEQTNGRPLSIRRFDTEKDVSDCHVLFVNLADPDQTASILENLKGQSILTIGEQDGFLESGGMVRFISVNSKIHFQINPDASSAADLKISSKLLRVADIVTLPDK